MYRLRGDEKQAGADPCFKGHGGPYLHRRRRQEKRPRRGAKRLGAAIAAVCTLLLLLGVWTVWNGAQAAMREQAAQSLRTAVLDAAVQCYALEGAYPQSLSYLEENYGVQVNHSRFIVSYEVYASNQLPVVAVLEKQTA